MSELIPFSLLFLAGGHGLRMGSAVPKQYLLLQDKPIALHSFEIFLQLSEMQEVIVVCEPAYQSIFQASADDLSVPIRFATPGQRRQDSVFNGMQQLTGNPLVCIHDAARPLINHDIVRQVVYTANSWEAAVAGVRVKSTIKICDGAQVIVETPARESLWEMQTPQVIRLRLLKEGFDYVNKQGMTVTDDVSLVEVLGKPVKVVEGSYTNVKVTTPEDLTIVKQLLSHHVLL